MSVPRPVIAALVASALAVPAALVTASSASALSCPAGQQDFNGSCAVVTDYPDETNIGTRTSGPAPRTGGLILRDAEGRDLGSGIGEGQQFKFTGCGPTGSGLIRVRQTTRGNGGGWGTLYSGYVKKRWTMAPQMWNECR